MRQKLRHSRAEQMRQKLLHSRTEHCVRPGMHRKIRFPLISDDNSAGPESPIQQSKLFFQFPMNF